MKKVLIAGAARTPIGALNGCFAQLSATELGRIAAMAALERSGLSAESMDEVIIGNVLQAGLGQNPARQIAIGCGVPVTASAYTVNQVCGSGLKAIDLAFRAVRAGEAAAILAGGTESMSGAPYILPALRQGARLGDCTACDTVTHDALTDVFGQYHMGMTAENIAEKFAIPRKAQDAFAVESQRRAAAAMAAGLFRAEMVPVTVKQRKQEIVIDADEYPRPQTDLAALAKLRPAFKPDGTVTAGNASGINDGGAAVVVAAEDMIQTRSQCVRIVDVAGMGCAPELMGLGPIGAVRKLLKNNGMNPGDIDLWELNEAFAVQSLAVIEQLGLDAAKVNVNGGAIALGHPVGASGARIVVTLMYQMKRRNAALGVASLCIGGGMGLAILLENI